MNILLPVDGVLRSDVGAPVQVGEDLYRSLVQFNRVVLCTRDREKDATWLLRRNLTEHADLRESPTLLDALAEERVAGHVELVIASDTDEAKKVFRQGIAVALLASTDFIDPRWRPERKSWGEIVEGENV